MKGTVSVSVIVMGILTVSVSMKGIVSVVVSMKGIVSMSVSMKDIVSMRARSNAGSEYQPAGRGPMSGSSRRTTRARDHQVCLA